MAKIDEAINRIRRLECPTGEVENSIALILEDYGVAAQSEVNIHRDKNFDKDESEAYWVRIADESQPIVVLAKTGYDGYVAKVVDAYGIS